MKRALVLIAALLAAPLAATDRDRVTIIGEEAHVKKETPHPVPQVEAGAEAWRDVFHWPKASYIAVHFEKFALAPGERVVVRTPDGRHAYAFEGEGKPGSGGAFWATHVPGDTCEVVYYGNGKEPGFGYVVDKFAHGFPAPAGPGSPQDVETVCGVDDGNWAKCYQDSEPVVYDKSRAIARLTINGVFSCTGWLVGCEGHLMTNAHCITNPVDALNTDYEFMAEGATCGTSCASFGGCPGVIEASMGEMISTGSQAVLDYSLVKLPGNLSTRYGFFKLRPTGAVVNERIYLNGHPSAWGKWFEIFSSDATDESGFCEITTLDEPPAPGCSALGPPDVGYMCDTRSGSSGSPVVAYSDHRVVVLHHCGGCPNRGVPIQDVIAAIGSNLPACTIDQFDGIVDLDADAYRCTGSVGIRVIDDHLMGAGAQSVSVSSSTETSPETVILAENPPGSGTFTGAIPLTGGAPSSGDGLLSVSSGDTVTVVYVDADDGQGGTNVPRTDTARVDCAPPVISDVAVSDVRGDGALVTWTTNEAASSSVDYGTTPPPGSTESNPSLVTSHAVRLTGLAPCTTYQLRVRSSDPAGNEAIDDNGGGLYTFTTRNSLALAATSGDTPVSIPDNSPEGATSTIRLNDHVVVSDVNVAVNITHTFDGDLKLFLITPTGTEILLSDMRGGDGDNFRDTIFDDEAPTSIALGTAPFTGSFRPERPLGAADGASAAGDWKLKVVDLGPTDFGTIDDWTLHVAYDGVCGPSLVHDSSAPAEACGGSGTGGGNGIVDPGEDVVLPVRIRNDGVVAMTGIRAALSTTTPGVTVTRAGATYPDIAVGATSVSNPPHFAFTVGSGVSCGTSIEFTLDMVSDPGSSRDTFTVMVGAVGTGTRTYDSTEVPRPLPDLVTVTSTVTVADTAVVRDVDVKVTILHTWDEDLDIFLIGPNGTRVELSTDNGGSGDNYSGTIFDDEAPLSITQGSPPFAGRFRPEGMLSTLDGIPANGTWTLEIRDDTLQDTGVLMEWGLILTTGPDLLCNDCAVMPPSGAPGPLVWSAGEKSSLEWGAAAGASFYHVYRGVEPDLPRLLDDSVDSCRRMTLAATTTGPSLTEAPSPAAFFWYLVRAANAGGEGPAGEATAGPRIQNSSGPCP